MLTNPLRLYRLLSGFAIAITVAVTWKLWSADRTFPTAPLIGIHSYISGTGGVIFKILLITAALLFAASVKFSEWVLALLLLVAAMDDLNRIRADIYPYFMIVLIYGAATLFSSQSLVKSLRIMHGGIYFWTGAQKLNPGFVHHGREFFSKALDSLHLPGWIGWLIVIVPLIEILIGVIFLTGKKFRTAIIVAGILHLLIIIQLTISGWNTTIIPYNVFLPLGNILLFGNSKNFEPSSTRNWLPKLSAVFFVILPAFSLVHLWPAYMSAGMYSYRTYYGAISVDKELNSKLPEVAKSTIYHTYYGDYLSYSDWLQAETGCVPNPEKFVYNKMFDQMRAKYEFSDSVKLYIYK